MLLMQVRDEGRGAGKSLTKQQDLTGYKKSTSI